MRDRRYAIHEGEGGNTLKERLPIRSAAGCPSWGLLRGLFASHSYPIDRCLHDMYKAYAIFIFRNSIRIHDLMSSKIHTHGPLMQGSSDHS